MKKASLALLCVATLAMFSFIKQPITASFTKLGTQLYKTAKPVAFKGEDQQNLKNILAKQYNITSFTSETTLSFQKVYDPKDPTKVVGFSMAEKTVGNSIFAQTMVNKGAGELDEVTQANVSGGKFNADVTSRLTAVLEKYKN